MRECSADYHLLQLENDKMTVINSVRTAKFRKLSIMSYVMLCLTIGKCLAIFQNLTLCG